MPREMKETGIEWIGEVPKDWEIVKLLFVLEKPITDGPHETPVYVEEGIPFITINNIDDRGNIDKINANRISIEDAIEYNKKAKMKKGDLLFSKSATIGKIAEVDELDFMVWSPFAIIRPNSKILNKNYLKKILSLPRYVNHAIGLGSYNTQVNIGMRDMEKTKIPLPSLEEQKKIADLLDKKCQEIEEIKETIEAEIKMLDEYKKSMITEAVTKGLDKDAEMKDSGIEWIGEIPKHWKVNKIGRICKVVTDFVASGSFASLAKNVTYLDEEDYAMLIRTVDLSNKRDAINRVYVDKNSYDFLRNSNLFGGEIILPNIGSVGDVYLVPKLYDKMTLGPNSIMIKTKYCDKYYYYLLSVVGKLILINLSAGSTQAKFNKTELKEVRLAQPPINEQKAIAEYLDHKTSAINEAIDGKRAQLVTLDEYKKSIIYEYVTGKKEA